MSILHSPTANTDQSLNISGAVDFGAIDRPLLSLRDTSTNGAPGIRFYSNSTSLLGGIEATPDGGGGGSIDFYGPAAAGKLAKFYHDGSRPYLELGGGSAGVSSIYMEGAGGQIEWDTTNDRFRFHGGVQVDDELILVDFPSEDCLGTDGSGLIISGNCGGGGGASTLGVTTGSISGFSNVISSPTGAIVFSSDTFGVRLTGASTGFVTLNMASVTVQGELRAGSNVTLTPGAGFLTIAASGSGGGGDNLGTHKATEPVNMNAKGIFNIGAGSSTFVGDGSLIVSSTNGTTSPSIFRTGIISSGTGVGSLSIGDSDGSNFVSLIGPATIGRDIAFELPSSTGPIGGAYLKVTAVNGSTATISVIRATHTAVIALSSGTTFNSRTQPVFQAPVNTSITIFNIRAWTMPSGSTVTYQLDERAWQSGNSAGTNVFSVTHSTAHNSGVETTSFNNASIAAGASLVLTTPSNSAAGNPTKFMLQISYREDD